VKLSPRPLSTALLILAIAVLGAGCGSSTSAGNYGGAHPDYARALVGSPAPLAALHAQHDRLLPGSTGAFDHRIAALKGFPVVVNVWASWCWPCRSEIPVLQRLSARYGKRVAFLGVNSDDSDAAASTFLKEAPLSYPSYSDPSKKIASALHVTIGLPDTAFYNPHGQLVYLKQGPYTHASELEGDLKQYALG
jgi:cytochrome c biogenesis protein CcmG, thiol:disulfide interchange protein DsbE